MQIPEITSYEILCPNCKKIHFRFQGSITQKDINDEFICPMCKKDVTKLITEYIGQVNKFNELTTSFKNGNGVIPIL